MPNNPISKKLVRHGGYGTPEYLSWAGMIQRCTNPKNYGYRYWGGRGIAVCERWRKFQNFLADMGTKPSHRHSIDRINNNGNYEPGNCRWATMSEQRLNSTTTRWLTFRGVTQPMKDWAHAVGLSYKTLSDRLQRGWSVEKAISTPTGPQGRKTKVQS